MTVAECIQGHKEGLAEKGLRPIRMWVPDTGRPGFAEECRRQSRLLAGDPQEKETLDWIESVSDFKGWA